MNKTNILSLPLSILVIIVLSGCGSAFIQRKGIDLISPALPNVMDAAMQLSSGQLAKEGLPGLIMLVSVLAETSPKNPTVLSTAAMACTAYAMLVEDYDEDYASELYLIAKGYAMRALKTDGKFRKVLEEEGTGGLPKVMEKMGKKHVPALFWTAMAWGGWMFLNLDDPLAFLGLPVVLAAVDRVYELDDEYFFGAPHLFYVGYYALMPPFMGGGYEKLNMEFKKCNEINDGEFYLAHVYYADKYAVTYDKHEEFKEMLDLVLNSPPAKNPELNLVNEIAKMKAKVLLEQEEELFPF